MKLTNILNEAKRISSSQSFIDVNYEIDGETIDGTFLEYELDFTNKGKAPDNKFDTELRGYRKMKKTVNQSFEEKPNGGAGEAGTIVNTVNKSSELKDLLDNKPELRDVEFGRLIDIARIKHKVDILGTMAGASGKADFYTPLVKFSTKKAIPSSPGIYLWVFNGNVVYVGEASSLNKRIYSYIKGHNKTDIALSQHNVLRNQKIAKTIMKSDPSKANDLVKLFVMELPADYDKNEIRSVESQLIKYFGTFPEGGKGSGVRSYLSTKQNRKR